MTKHMPHVVMSAIPHDGHRYSTVGDWKFSTSGAWLGVYVSRMVDWRYEALVGVHELVEALLCKARGISEADVTAFDVKFEEWRKAELARFMGPKEEADEMLAREPGDDPTSPYHREHRFATQVEKLLAAELGVDWFEYEATIEAL